VTFVFLSGSSERGSTAGRYKVVLLNNRDEQFQRPTSILHWEGNILAGRALEICIFTADQL